MNTCDICGSNKNVKAGRWIFYCPKHKQNDLDQTLENEILPDLKSGNFNYIADDPELQEIMLNL